jgi:hypothetical protein
MIIPLGWPLLPRVRGDMIAGHGVLPASLAKGPRLDDIQFHNLPTPHISGAAHVTAVTRRLHVIPLGFLCSGEGEGVSGGAQRADYFRAVLGAARLDLKDHLDLVHVQSRGQPLMPDLEHVGTKIGQVSEEFGE